MNDNTNLNDGPKNHVRLEDEDGEAHDLPLVEECCGDYEVEFEETPFGAMETCENCGDYV